MIKDMETGMKGIRTGIDMKANLKKGKLMAKACITGTLERYTMESGRMVSRKETGFGKE